MKKTLLLSALIACLMVGTAEAKTKMYLVANSHPAASDGAASVGIRMPVGNLSVDVWPMVSMSKSGSTTTTTIPFYVDVYSGNWGVAFASTNLGGSAAVNKVQFQFAAEQMLNDNLGFGAFLNVAEYVLSGTGATGTIAGDSGTIGLLTGLQSYIIIGFDM